MIRDATAADVPAIARMHTRAWQRAYVELISPEALDVDEGTRAEGWAELVADPERFAWVWDQDGTIAGAVTVVGQDLRSLYVDPIAQGAGVGSALLDHAVAAGAASLRTFAANAAARTFYEHRGWAFDGDEEPWRGEPVVRYVLAA